MINRIKDITYEEIDYYLKFTKERGNSYRMKETKKWLKESKKLN